MVVPHVHSRPYFFRFNTTTTATQGMDGVRSKDALPMVPMRLRVGNDMRIRAQQHERPHDFYYHRAKLGPTIIVKHEHEPLRDQLIQNWCRPRPSSFLLPLRTRSREAVPCRPMMSGSQATALFMSTLALALSAGKASVWDTRFDGECRLPPSSSSSGGFGPWVPLPTAM